MLVKNMGGSLTGEETNKFHEGIGALVRSMNFWRKVWRLVNIYHEFCWQFS